MIAIDLLTWPEYQSSRAAYEAELDEVARAVQDAHVAYDQALRRSRCAPHGEAVSRKAELRAANARVLRAELALNDLRRREPRWE